MAQIKGYTDIEQSKKLAKILPLESADMYYFPVPVREWKDKEDISKGTQIVFKNQIFVIENLRDNKIGEEDTYAWSLAALFNVLSNVKLCHYNDKYFCQHIGLVDEFPKYSTFEYDNPIDACYEMTLHLHELNLL